SPGTTGGCRNANDRVDPDRSARLDTACGFWVNKFPAAADLLQGRAVALRGRDRRVGADVDHGRQPGRPGLVQGPGEVAGLVYPGGVAAEAPGDRDQVAVVETPVLVLVGGVGVPQELLLVQRRVVVDHHDHVQPVAPGGLQLGDVVEEAAVTGQADHLAVRAGGLHAEG